VGENKVLVNVNGLLVVLCCLGKFSENKMKLSAVIVDIRVFLILLNSFLKVVRRRILVSYTTLV